MHTEVVGPEALGHGTLGKKPSGSASWYARAGAEMGYRQAGIPGQARNDGVVTMRSDDQPIA